MLMTDSQVRLAHMASVTTYSLQSLKIFQIIPGCVKGNMTAIQAQLTDCAL